MVIAIAVSTLMSFALAYGMIMEYRILFPIAFLVLVGVPMLVGVGSLVVNFKFSVKKKPANQ